MTFDNESNHVCVCICTYRRPELLKRLLESLREQETGGLFTYSIVVCDNDSLRSAEDVASGFAASSHVPLLYCVQPERSVSLTRNRALEHATGNYIAFLDDDEFAPKRRLLTLLETCIQRDVDGVMGPVESYFEQEPPKWVRKGKFYRHSDYPTGAVVDWTSARTGNVLFKRRILPAGELPFRPQFQGGAARLQPTFGARDTLRSLVAVATYAVALPFALALGHHKFMMLLVRSCDHVGKLLALLGIRPIKQPWVTE